MNNAFDDMMKGRSVAERRAAEEARWEEALVQYTLKQFGRNKPWIRRDMAKSWYDRHRVHALKFQVFNETFSTFPMVLGISRLGGKHVHRDTNATEPARFRKFSRVPFVEAYSQFYDENYSKQDLRNLGLVFPRKGFKQGMIIHNDESEVFWTSGLCWVYKSKKGQRLYVQPFNDLLAGIKASRLWQPD